MKFLNNNFTLLKNKLTNSEFIKNVLILSGGTAIAQIFYILISPILSRLYNPSDFGIFSIFVSIISIVSVIANGNYQLAIMLPEKDEDSINVASVAFLFNIFVNSIFFVIIIIFKTPLLKILKAEALSFWIYLGPITSFFIGIFQILNYLNNRFKIYKDIAKSKIIKTLTGSIIQLISGIFKFSPGGLILGFIMSNVVSNTKLFLNIKKISLLEKINISKIKLMFKKYNKFPKITLFQSLLDSLQNTIIIFFLTSFYDSMVVGYYSLSMRLINLPSQLISLSLYQVLYQKITNIFNEKKSLLNFFIKYLKNIIIYSTPIFLIIYFIPNKLFYLIMGNQWPEIGNYIKSITIWQYWSFIASPLSIFFFVTDEQKSLFLISIFGKIIIIFSLFIGYLLKFKSINVLYSISFLITIYFIFAFYWVFKLLKKFDKNQRSSYDN